LNANQSLKFVMRVWQNCAPTTDSPFAELDRQIIRATLQKNFRDATGLTSLHAKRQFKKRIESSLTSLVPSMVQGIDWVRYLAAKSNNSNDILCLAAGTDLPASEKHSLQVIARGVLLLRIASGACEKLMQTLSLQTRQDAKKWIEIVGHDRALWSHNNAPSQINDLWTDIEDALGTIQSDNDSILSYSDLWRRHANAVAMLCTFERTGLWGLKV
jgi:hypothetical protein